MEDHKGIPPAPVSTVEEPQIEIDEIEEKPQEKGSSSSSSSSSSDSEDEKEKVVKDKVWRLFGREKSVHTVLGGGKPADALLWKNKKISGGILSGATAIWVLFELLEYHLLSLVCHCLIISLSVFFLWSKATTLINKSPPHIPEVLISEDLARNTAVALRAEINRALAALRCIASGRDVRKFIAVVAGLWILSVVGRSFTFLTLFYIVFVLLHTVPVLYEKYEDKVDPCAKKAMEEIKKHYTVIEAKVRSKIPKGAFKLKKNE